MLKLKRSADDINIQKTVLEKAFKNIQCVAQNMNSFIKEKTLHILLLKQESGKSLLVGFGL